MKQVATSTTPPPAAGNGLFRPLDLKRVKVGGELGRRAKVFFHSCGNVYSIINDLIDIGVDILNPVQVSAGEMADTARLKKEFGSRLLFRGAIDTRNVLPHGDMSDVRREVRRRIADLAPGGGYIAAAVHCIQPDVPPANVAAMCHEVRVSGNCPTARGIT